MQVRDNVSWMHDMEAVIESDEPAKSVSGAEEQLGRHEQHRVSARGRVYSLLSHIVGTIIYCHYILVLYIGTILYWYYIGTIYWYYILELYYIGTIIGTLYWYYNILALYIGTIIGTLYWYYIYIVVIIGTIYWYYVYRYAQHLNCVCICTHKDSCKWLHYVCECMDLQTRTCLQTLNGS